MRQPRLRCVVAALALMVCTMPWAAETSLPGRLVDVGGYRLHIHCTGHGGPTVLLEAGLGGMSLEWSEIQDDLSHEFRVCSYDRAGYGWSDPGPAPRTSLQIAVELERLLDGAGERPPYILVAHSFGGYPAQVFVRRHPAEVAGLVLLDASHPHQFAAFDGVLPQSDLRQRHFDGRRLRSRQLLARPRLPANYPRSVRGLAYRLMLRRSARRTVRDEYLNMPLSAVEVEQAGKMPDRPVLVVSRGRQGWPATPRGRRLEQIWNQLQADLANLTPHAQRVIASYSGHYVHLDQPGLTVRLIRQLSRDAMAAYHPGGLTSAGG